jgi:zinc D-Ala-D-Ala carboxypeptidase
MKMMIFTQSKRIDYLKRLLTGQLDYTNEPDFRQISPIYCSGKKYLQKEAYFAFEKMTEAAKKTGINLKILSAARDFATQKSIWEKKWKQFAPETDELTIAKTILQFSAMPMTSRHHWGTDIDLNCLENDNFEQGKGKEEFDWLQKNAHTFGFWQVYDDKNTSKRNGYELEKWHWSYLPLASEYLYSYLKLISYNDIRGFIGAELAPNLRIIEEYVAGISISDHFKTERSLFK